MSAAASSLTAVDYLRSLDASLAALSVNIIMLGEAVCALRDPKAAASTLFGVDWHEHRRAPVDGNDRVLALASIMNQRRLVRNCGKITILQKGGKARMANKLGRQDSVMLEDVILTARPFNTCCVLL